MKSQTVTTMKTRQTLKTNRLPKKRKSTNKTMLDQRSTRTRGIRATTGIFPFTVRHFKRQNKNVKVIPESERLITEKNEWGDYKVKGLQINQLEKDQALVDLNKSVIYSVQI
jgi:hypothetical protein